jgi:large subunit ribosomal protein L25
MKLTVAKRTAKTKSETRNIRREGKIPAILYSKREPGKEIVVDSISFRKILNTTPTGTLSSKIFTLDLEGQAIKAIVKDIQYNITTYDVIHIDFEQLHDDLPVTLNIPLRCINAVNCVGVKLGGVVRQVVRQVKVTCLPKHIPEEFEIDILDLNVGQMKKLQDLEIPEGVRPVGSFKGVAVIIARK